MGIDFDIDPAMVGCRGLPRLVGIDFDVERYDKGTDGEKPSEGKNEKNPCIGKTTVFVLFERGGVALTLPFGSGL